MKNKKIVYAIIIIPVVLALILTVKWYNTYLNNLAILQKIETMDYTSAEKQVGNKLRSLAGQVHSAPDLAEAWGKLGMTLYIHDYKELSVDCFQKAHALNNEEFKWPYFTAITLDELNQQESVVWYEKSIPLYSPYPPLNVKLGNRYLLSGNNKKARRAFRSIIDAGFQVPHAHLGLARLDIDTGRTEEAENHLRKAISIAPQYREAHAVLADLFRRMGRTSEAEAEFLKMKDHPDRLDLKDPVYYLMVEEGVSSFWHQVRGNNYLKERKFAEAGSEFQKAVRAKPNQVSYNSLGYVYQKQKRYRKAIECYLHALELDSTFVSSINNLGVIYFEQGKIDAAIRLVKNALKINPESVDACLNLGTFFKSSGDRGKAVYFFKRGVLLDPDDMRFAFQLAWLQAASPEQKIRDPHSALRFAEKVASSSAYDRASVLDLQAIALAANNRFEEAAQLAAEAHRIAGKTGNIRKAVEINQRRQLFLANKPFRMK